MPPTTKNANKLLFTKYWDWRYEQEWRNWFQLDEREDPGHSAANLRAESSKH
jgi:hypothetical protein